ncbi:head-tail joining protein [Pseudomonas soli]|uniref:head-tail joining protein n=1 Tax=Pseudomonas soli TaxID=1306993 RepID=UPI003DA80539
MTFREAMSDMDESLLEELGDEVEIEGFAEPVQGFMSVPWQQPRVGSINTGLRQPVFSVRVAQANGIREGLHLVCDLAPADGGGRYVIAKREPDGGGWINFALREVK